MISLLQSLFFSFCHPFKFATYIRGEGPLPKNWSDLGIRPLCMTEAITLSWIFKIISGILTLIVLSYGKYFTLIHPQLKIGLFSEMFIVYVGLSIAFFPIQLVFIVAIWKWVIRIFVGLYLEEDEVEDHLDQVLSHSLSCNVMMAIPFVGTIFQELLWPLYLFAGFRNTYQLSYLRASSIFFLFFSFLVLLFLAFLLAMALIVFV